MLTKVNTDMISDPSIVQSSEKLCEIFIALVSEVGARFEDSGMRVDLTTQDSTHVHQ